MRVFYLHGFASSPKSTKVQYFTEGLATQGIAVRCPDFNAPEFVSMTMTRMLGQLEAELAQSSEPAALIGSSLGGTLAILAAARFADRVNRLVLLAPAVMFGDPDHHLLRRDAIDRWRERGEHEFMHHADGRLRRLAYAFYEDSLKYDAFGTLFAQPSLTFQGTRDAVVNAKDVERFASTRPNVTLSLVDDDHQLIASLPRIWTDVQPFLST